MIKKSYIINLVFGTWQNQSWFSGNDDELTQIRWEVAKKGLAEVAEGCTNSNDFFNKAIQHFENYGFSRIQK